MVKLIKADFDGHAMQFNDSGWFNATAAADKFGKDAYEWTRLPSTNSYIKSKASALNAGKSTYSELIVTKRGRYGGGTWIHPDLAVFFCSWLDADLAKSVAEHLGKGVQVVSVSGIERRETEFGREVVYNMFSAYKIYDQYPVFGGKYRIDWYIPELNLAIEFDEEHHRSNVEDDEMRQKEIESELGCKFARYKV